MIFLLILLVPALILMVRGTQIVPHQEVWIVQRLGRFHRKLESGLNWVIPAIDQVAYRHSLKEEAIDVTEQTAITQDNVSLVLDGIVYIKVFDPIAASYGVKDPIHALTQLVQTTMRSEIGKIALDKTFEEREALNAKIVEAINEASHSWGIRCLRYEIKDIKMPEEIRKAMELQMTAERQKRARILESEGVRQAKINESEGYSEAQINSAKAQAETIEMLARASSRSIDFVASSLAQSFGERAAALQIAEKYIEAFGRIAKETNTVVLASSLAQPSNGIAEAMTLYETLTRFRGTSGSQKVFDTHSQK
jgi:regulator of protease activity HflC (stomatin/prohibitin superfamily)